MSSVEAIVTGGCGLVESPESESGVVVGFHGARFHIVRCSIAFGVTR
jgi:hypothetical protein